MDDKRQMQVIPFNSPIFTESEQKTAVIYSELTAIVYAIDIHVFLIVGSKHPLTILTENIPLLSFFAREGKINLQFFKYHFVLTPFPKFVIFWTQGQNRCLADLLAEILQQSFQNNITKCIKHFHSQLIF